MTTFKDVYDYLMDEVRHYEFDAGEDGCYTPTEQERYLLEWFAAGLVEDRDLMDMIASAYKERSDRRASEGRCRGCGAPKGTHWGRQAECDLDPEDA